MDIENEEDVGGAEEGEKKYEVNVIFPPFDASSI